MIYDQNNFFDEQLVIHLGFHKTGSTFLQRSVFPNINVNYCIAPRSEPLMDLAADRADFIRSVTPRCFDVGSKISVYSHEVLSGGMIGENFWISETIAQRLKSFFPNAKILIVVREQLSYIGSAYLHRTRSFEHRSFSEFIKVHEEKFVFKLNYQRLVSLYISLFGAQNVQVLPYEQLVQSPAEFIENISEFIGGEKYNFKDFAKSAPLNVASYNSLECNLNRAINAPLNYALNGLRHSNLVAESRFQAIKRRTHKIKSRLFRQPFRKFSRIVSPNSIVEMPGALQERLLGQFRTGNKALSELIGVDLASYGYSVEP